MKTKKNLMFISILFLLSLIISLVSASTQVIFTETFEYSNSFTTHNWKYEDGGCSGDVDSPINSPFGSNAYGYNETNRCAFTHGRAISKNFSETNLSEGILIMSYSYSVLNDSTDLSNVMRFGLFREVGSSSGSSDGIYFNHRADKQFVSDCAGGTGCITCNLTNETENLFPFESETFVVELDLNARTYSWFLNGSFGVDCLDVSYGTDVPFFKGLALGNSLDSSEYLGVWFDNIVISGTNLSVEEFGLSSPCETNSDCISGKCEYGFCALKGSSEECNSDNECLSSNCLNGKCTKPSLWEGIEASKNQQFGDDSNSNNFIALFFIIGIPACFIWVGRSTASVFIGTGIFFFLSIFFTIVGWLSPFILIGNIMMALIVVVFMFMLKGGSD